MVLNIVSAPIGALVCVDCLVLVAHVTHEEPITLGGEPYIYDNPLTFCFACGAKLTQLNSREYTEFGSWFKYKRGSRGY